MDKFCIDCKHFVPAGELCAKTKRAPDYVRGTLQPMRRAQDSRIWTLADDCSPAARFFEAIAK